MNNNVECLNCGWIGIVDGLVCTDHDPDNFSYCPDCDSSDLEFEIDEEDEIEEGE